MLRILFFCLVGIGLIQPSVWLIAERKGRYVSDGWLTTSGVVFWISISFIVMAILSGIHNPVLGDLFLVFLSNGFTCLVFWADRKGKPAVWDREHWLVALVICALEDATIFGLLPTGGAGHYTPYLVD